MFLHFGGTGVMGFHTKYVPIKYDIFKIPNMADIWVGKYAQKNKIKIIGLKHPDKWILYNDKMYNKETIYELHNNNCDIQNTLIQDFNKIIPKDTPVKSTRKAVEPTPTPKPKPKPKPTQTLKARKPKNYKSRTSEKGSIPIIDNEGVTLGSILKKQKYRKWNINKRKKIW